jgi:hypothetical protein
MDKKQQEGHGKETRPGGDTKRGDRQKNAQVSMEARETDGAHSLVMARSRISSSEFGASSHSTRSTVLYSRPMVGVTSKKSNLSSASESWSGLGNAVDGAGAGAAVVEGRDSADGLVEVEGWDSAEGLVENGMMMSATALVVATTGAWMSTAEGDIVWSGVWLWVCGRAAG